MDNFIYFERAILFIVYFSGNGKLASCGCIIGFIVMMALDVGLG